MRRPFGSLFVLPLLVGGGLLLAGFSSKARSYRLRVIPKFGHMYTMRFQGDLATEDTKLTIDGKVRLEVVSQEPDGGFTARMTTIFSLLSQDGTELPANEPAVQMTRYDKDGREVESSAREPKNTALDVALAFESDKPVKIGEKYTPEKRDEGDADPMEWKVVGLQTLDGQEVLHLSAYGRGPEGEFIASDVYLDPESLWVRKGVAKIKGYPESGTTVLRLTGTDELAGKG